MRFMRCKQNQNHGHNWYRNSQSVAARMGERPERKSDFRSGPLAQKLNFNPNCTLRGLLALPKLPKLPEPTVKDALPRLPSE